MNKAEINSGVFPTMITPYKKDGSIDYDAARRLTEFYIENGCHGIFAVCQQLPDADRRRGEQPGHRRLQTGAQRGLGQQSWKR